MENGDKNGVDMGQDPFNLHRVVMPIIRTMRDVSLSWSQREECAWALQECLRQHGEMMDEHNYHMQSECQKATGVMEEA